MAHATHQQEPRWRRLPEERPRQILAAALAVFGEHGLAASRLDDIAKRAGLSKGTIYLYFANKEELFRAVVQHTVIRKIEEGEELASSPTASAMEMLTGFTRRYWAFVRSGEFAPIFRLVHAEILDFPDLARFYADEVVARGHRLITSIIARGIETGEFRAIDPAVAARMLNAQFIMHGLWCTHPEYFQSVSKKSDEQVLDEMMQFYLYALRPDDRDPSRTPGMIS